MYLNIILLVTLIILVIPFIIYFKNTDKKGKIQLIFAGLIYLIIASPVIYGVVNHKIVQYKDADIGLGISFFITWILTICAFVISIYYFIKKRSK